MRTNGSQSGHIQVDKQTIETALDDEGGSRRRRQQQQQEVDLNEENDKKKATASSSVLLLRNGNGGNGLQQQQSSPDLLDILDNFLITTSNPDETAASNAISQVSHAQMDNSTNISTRLVLSIPKNLKMRQKVSFNISSDARYVYILSEHKFIENAKENGQLKVAVKNYYQPFQFYLDKNWWNMPKF